MLCRVNPTIVSRTDGHSTAVDRWQNPRRSLLILYGSDGSLSSSCRSLISRWCLRRPRNCLWPPARIARLSHSFSSIVKDSGNARHNVLAVPIRNGYSKAGIIQAPSSALIAPSERSVPASFCTLQPEFSHVKPENTALNRPANPELETIGAFNTARISTALPHQAPAYPSNKILQS